MYTQALSLGRPQAAAHQEDPQRLARFQARIDAEERIEPTDWMPAAYRQTLIRQISPLNRSTLLVDIPSSLVDLCLKCPLLFLLLDLRESLGELSDPPERIRDGATRPWNTGSKDATAAIASDNIGSGAVLIPHSLLPWAFLWHVYSP